MFFALTTGVLLTLGAFWTYHELTSPPTKPILSIDILEKLGIKLPDFLKQLFKEEATIVAVVDKISSSQHQSTSTTNNVKIATPIKTPLQTNVDQQIANLISGKRVHPGLLGQANLKDILDKKAKGESNEEYDYPEGSKKLKNKI